MAAPPQRPGTGWVNFQRILGLNQGQAQAMGQQVAKSVGDQAKKSKDQLTGAQATFKEKLKGAELPDAASFGAQAAAEGATTEQKGSIYTAAGAAAAKAKAGYTGPNSLGDVADTKALGQSLNAAAGRVAGLNSTGGLASALQSLYGRTTTGGSALDAALAGAGGAQELAAVRGQYSDLGRLLPEAEAQAMKDVEAVKAMYNPASFLSVQEEIARQIKQEEDRRKQEDLIKQQIASQPRQSFDNFTPNRIITTREGTNAYGGRG